MLTSHLVIGEILKPQGIRGEVKVKPITCDPFRFQNLKEAFFEKDGGYEPVKILAARVSPEAVYLALDGVTDRDQAEKMRGRLLYIDRGHAVVLSEDETFLCDLIGLSGTDTNGRDIGKIAEVMQPGGNDVYVFRGPLGEVLVPALKSVVLKVDIQAGTMLLDAARLSEVAVFDED